MELNKEDIARSFGKAFATTFWEITKDELPKNFTWDKFFKKHKDYVREKIHLYYKQWPEGDELLKMQNIAEEGFQEGIEELKIKNPIV